MRLARNSEGSIIKCQDIENGVVKSNEYYCNKCDNVVFYISGSERNCSHFRHKKDKSCIYYYNNQIGDDCFEANIMSEFHRNWQEIFPNENIEYKIEKNEKKHYADIYISYHTTFNICDIFEKNKSNMVIEIQYSAISYTTLYEREKHYISDDTNLIWIFNVKDKCEVERVVLFNETIYRLRLKGKHYFTELFKINKTQNILLDNGGLYLYLIINKPEYDKELLQVKKISRKTFLQQISNILGKEIKNVCDTSNNRVKVYDYENTIINIQDISNKNKDQLRYIFYVLETIPFSYLNDIFEEYNNTFSDEKWYCDNCSFDNFWNNQKCWKCKYSKPFNIGELISILSIISNKHESILNIFTRFVEKNRANVNTTISFGKYSGYELVDISAKYLDWLKENKDDKYCKCSSHFNDICKNCKLYEDINYVLRYSRSSIQGLFTTIYEHEGMRYFDYTFTDFVYNYNKMYDKNVLLQINGSRLCNEEFKTSMKSNNINKYQFINDD
jgi:competence CoiA-like predicted nuclease